jgi:hypothetical protein
MTDKKIVHELRANAFWLGQHEAKSRRPRRPSLNRLIKAAEKSGKQVTSVTRDGTTISFGGEPATDTSNEWDRALGKH